MKNNYSNKQPVTQGLVIATTIVLILMIIGFIFLLYQFITVFYIHGPYPKNYTLTKQGLDMFHQNLQFFASHPWDFCINRIDTIKIVEKHLHILNGIEEVDYKFTVFFFMEQLHTDLCTKVVVWDQSDTYFRYGLKLSYGRQGTDVATQLDVLLLREWARGHLGIPGYSEYMQNRFLEFYVNANRLLWSNFGDLSAGVEYEIYCTKTAVSINHYLFVVL